MRHNPKNKTMNYEELLASRRQGKLYQTPLPIGEYCRQQIDGKYRSVVEIHTELQRNIKFTEALRKECEQNMSLTGGHQIHFKPTEEQGEIVRLDLEPGQYIPLWHVINERPSIVAEPHFMENLTTGLLQAANSLHQQGQYYVCFSPQTVFLRKGDQAVMLLSSGSHYLSLSNQKAFYGETLQHYVAPEVLAHGTIDQRCDIYSIGVLLQEVFADADMPIAYRKALEKAVSEVPEDRFTTTDEMLHSIQRRKNFYHGLTTMAIAVVAALICVGLYFDLMPEQENIEFVKPAPRQATDDLIEDGFRPEDLGVTSSDSLQEEAVATQREYDAKAEEIFRKRYEQEANRILSKIYDKTNMSNNEKQFRAKSESNVKELQKAQEKLVKESAIDPTRGQAIASEIIERLTNQKRAALGMGTNANGVQK